jgi:hypothetical protein
MITIVKEAETARIKVEFIPVSPFCPIVFKLTRDIKADHKNITRHQESFDLLPRHMMKQQIKEITFK